MMKNFPRTAEEVLAMLRKREHKGTETTKAVPPAGSTASIIARIWAEVLGLQNVGIEDNIFSLGGDSLHIVQIASQIHEVFGVEVTFGEFFDAPTVRELESLVARELSTRSSTRQD